MEAGAQPEVQTILPFGEQTQIWQFWERDNHPDSGLLTRTLNYAPVIGRRRVYIIERAETLNESAANSLLKVLEEPPPYVLFILSAPHPARVLPTIVSRSQMIRLIPAPRRALADYLCATCKIEEHRAELYAALSEGKTGQAVSLAQTPRVGEEIGRVLDFAETIPAAPALRALLLAEQMRKLATQMKALTGDETASVGDYSGDDSDGAGTVKDKSARRKIAALFDLLVVFYRDLMALAVGGEVAADIMNRERTAALTKLARGSKPDRWIRCLDSLMIARRRLEANASIPMVTDVLMISLVA
jgi:DNA polymerase-3 subunit delta'